MEEAVTTGESSELAKALPCWHDLGGPVPKLAVDLSLLREVVLLQGVDNWNPNSLCYRKWPWRFEVRRIGTSIFKASEQAADEVIYLKASLARKNGQLLTMV